MTTSARPGPDDPTYGFKTSVLGATWAFRLTPNAIVWDKGRHSGSAAYLSVTRVRMTFRPVSMQSYRFTAEIWSEQGPKLTIASTSWKSMMEQERLDARYSTFVAELHRRIAAAHGPAIFEAGIPPVIYWVGIVVYAAVALGFAALIVRALQAGAWGGAGIVAIFLGMLFWNGNYFRRNRPGHYRPEALPPLLMPSG